MGDLSFKDFSLWSYDHRYPWGTTSSWILLNQIAGNQETGVVVGPGGEESEEAAVLLPGCFPGGSEGCEENVAFLLRPSTLDQPKQFLSIPHP